MATSQSNRTRWAAAPPQSWWQQVLQALTAEGVGSRVLVCLVASLLLLTSSTAWIPAFPFRIRQTPTREMTARVNFEYVDAEATMEARERARTKILCLYENDPQPLRDIRQAAINKVFELLQKPVEEALPIWSEFFPVSAADDMTLNANAESLERFKQILAGDEKLEKLQSALERAFLEQDKRGLLESLTHEIGRGSMREIKVYQKGNLEDTLSVEVSQVRLAEVAPTLHLALKREVQLISEKAVSDTIVADRLFDWLRPKLPVTLKWNEDATRDEAKAAAEAVTEKKRSYQVGQPLQRIYLLSNNKSVLGGGIPLVEGDIQLLRAEYDAWVQALPWTSRISRTLVFLMLALTCFGLASTYLFQRHPQLLADRQQFAVLIGAFCVTYIAMWLAAMNVELRLEIVPLVLFSMAIAIAYQVGLAIMLSSLVVLLFTVAHGYAIDEFVVLSAAATVSSLFCKTIRSRTKSVYIGLLAAAIVFPLTIAIQFMLSMEFRSVNVIDALWFAGGAGFAGLIMTALLPFLEKWFDIQTDISLLELSDPNHPLLKQLIQRAPGTYNHSINVASIAEAAAESIGANGLLCRVGAYFHDIGKMRKPEYFVENQVGGANKHDDLVPTMSTIVIISHVKDGAELARKYHLPHRIIDMIEQHHGTTVVEFFFHRAAQQCSESGKDDERIEEANFRYPGPKPQSPEAAVLMLADAIEGACRSLREPGPARIESLVREITKKKLDDGQFDDCQITIQQLRTVQLSLVKSLNAMYHARIKYPDQQTV